MIAQRLVRRLCSECAEAAEPLDEVVAQIAPWLNQLPQLKWRQANGCGHCHGTGYRGRIGIHERVNVTHEMQHLILQGATPTAMQALAIEQGSLTLRQDGLLKAAQGITSVEEVLRVTGV